MRILLAEDDRSLHRVLVKKLKEADYAVDGCFDGEEALDYLEAADYDCVILDWMLPKMDGIQILRQYRADGYTTPVLMLTARDAVSDRVKGLDAGADDYLVKPFSFEELFARIRAMLRRGGETKVPLLQTADLTMDTAAHIVKRAGKEIFLTSREYALLEYLMRNQGIVVSRMQIADHVWNFDFDSESNIVDVYIRYLRNKIDRNFSPPLIHTVRGVGYVLRVE
ncbi:MAG: response regulator transcription factor [Oscillospiraceae bacterium]|nr:response regulator transcription factor [Oscillospiraceae bacterium]